MRVRDPTTPGWDSQIELLRLPGLKSGPEDLRWGLSWESIRGFSSLFLLEDGSSVFRGVEK